MNEQIPISAELRASVQRRLHPEIQQIAIRDHDQWMRERSQDFTASVAGCLFGVHPYTSEYEQHMLKSGQITADPEETIMQRQGRLLEPVAIQLLREQRPDWTVDYPHRIYYRDVAARLGATPDAPTRDDCGDWGNVQVKVVERWVFKAEWCDEAGEISPPLSMAIQTIVEAHLIRAKWAAIAVLIVGGGVELKIVPVPIHDRLIARVKEKVAAFWEGVRMLTPPNPDYSRDGALIEQLFRGNGEVVDMSGDNALVALVDEKERLAADAKSAKVRLDEIKAEILDKLSGASAARIAGGRVITAKRVERSGYTVEPYSYVDLRIKNGARK